VLLQGVSDGQKSGINKSKTRYRLPGTNPNYSTDAFCVYFFYYLWERPNFMHVTVNLSIN
jgi:hypothetical protein